MKLLVERSRGDDGESVMGRVRSNLGVREKEDCWFRVVRYLFECGLCLRDGVDCGAADLYEPRPLDPGLPSWDLCTGGARCHSTELEASVDVC